MIRGRVQGVGFRYFVARRALALALAGWVRNRPDGAVEVEAEGPRGALERLVEAAGEGPAGARVTELKQGWSERPPVHQGFRITD